jgi:ferredoxin
LHCFGVHANLRNSSSSLEERTELVCISQIAWPSLLFLLTHYLLLLFTSFAYVRLPGLCRKHAWNLLVWEISLFPDRCVGCHSCELACSYHHGRKFGRTTSSIEVNVSKSGAVETRIRIYTDKHLNHVPCNLCVGEKMPLCVKFCPVEALVYRVQS